MTQPPNRNQPSDRGGRSRPVPLEQRLEGVRLGLTSPAVVQALLVRLALSPIMAFPGPDIHAAEELVRLANEETLARTDPAVRRGWDLDRACLASVAWLVEQAFVLREQHSRDSKTWRRLSEVTRRTTKDLALVVRPGVMGLVGHACAGRFKSAEVLESWAARNEAAAAIAGTRPDADAELSLQALCCLPLDRVYAACRDLVASGPASPEDAYYLGSLPVTEVESLIVCDEEDSEGGHRSALDVGYGLVMGGDESKAIAMSVLDHSLRADDVRFPTQDQEFVLTHIDGVEATGFISHLKLPHYVTFQSKLDSAVRSMRDAAAAEGGASHGEAEAHGEATDGKGGASHA